MIDFKGVHSAGVSCTTVTFILFLGGMPVFLMLFRLRRTVPSTRFIMRLGVGALWVSVSSPSFVVAWCSPLFKINHEIEHELTLFSAIPSMVRLLCFFFDI